LFVSPGIPLLANEITRPTDRAPSTRNVLHKLVPLTPHAFEQHAFDPVESAHGRLRARLGPMRMKRHRSARIRAAGHAFVQNLHRGHYDIATEVSSLHMLGLAFDDLALAN